MKQNRRNFLRASTASTLGILALGTAACKSKAMDKKSYNVGVQLYSIRDAMSADVPGTLKRVSDMGYKNLEMANYSNGMFYGYAPKEFKKMANDLGMDIISSHTSVEADGISMASAQKMADAHAELGVKYCVQPWVQEVDRHVEAYKKMVGEWNKVAEVMKGVGIQFGYHNHNFEFDNLDGIVPYYDIFMKEMDPELITMEIDLFWVTKAGQDPVEMFKKYPGRFQLFHFKDMAVDNAPYYDIQKNDITSVGEGLIDFKRIYDARDIAGMKYFFVEDDNQGNGKPFEGIQTSIDNVISTIL